MLRELVHSWAPFTFIIMTFWDGICFPQIYHHRVSLACAFPASHWTYISFQQSQYVLACLAILVPTGYRQRALALILYSAPMVCDRRSQLCRRCKSAENGYLQSNRLSVNSLHPLQLWFRMFRSSRWYEIVFLNQMGIWLLIPTSWLFFKTWKHLVCYWYDFCYVKQPFCLLLCVFYCVKLMKYISSRSKRSSLRRWHIYF